MPVYGVSLIASRVGCIILAFGPLNVSYVLDNVCVRVALKLDWFLVAILITGLVWNSRLLLQLVIDKMNSIILL